MTPASPPHFRFREIAEPLRGAIEVSIKDSALIVIDAQRFYLADGDWPVHDILETNKTIEALVKRYRSVGGEHTPLDCIAGLEALEGEKFITKAQGSSFVGTDLDEYLVSKNLKNIVLVGYQPQFCIITTAVYGHHLGYRVFVVRDAIGSHNLHSWDNARDIKGSELVESACDLISDALGVVVKATDILN
ncbi:hypothetical protein NliqN6_5805 [Naganishia liquefaciens]|uniref:Isochorismatase-like domain-containing protein n=1 Tax=Naganishia liquefaciens TaxID=104408 RepID=A0A8H3TYY8_9TREE|nr:hypothetical protein NliqN6_5805 [Naganishia liquefaciens]